VGTSESDSRESFHRHRMGFCKSKSLRHFRDSIESTSFVDLQWALETIRTFLRATSHMRLIAHETDHYTSTTLIGGKGGASPSSLLHTTIEGPTEYVKRQDGLKLFIYDIEWIVFCGYLEYFQTPSLGGRSNTKPGD
jgi:hypothetical protein